MDNTDQAKAKKKSGKPSQSKFYIISFVFVAILMFIWSFTIDMHMPFDSWKTPGIVSYGGVHTMFNVLFWIAIVAFIVTLFVDMAQDGDGAKIYTKFYVKKDRYGNYSDEDDGESIRFKKRWIVWPLIIILLFATYGWMKRPVGQAVNLYNTSVLYQNSYEQKVQEKAGFYDKLWKTYLAKEKITNINKETFLQVTKIIMENRKDGQQVTWKWVQENQQIPYSEFTKFYADLSDFITGQREGYFNIEKECQTIANQNNTMLDTFPNNVYNWFLKCPKIKFEYGFLSDSTVNVFKSKRENVK